MRIARKLIARTLILAGLGWMAACNGHIDKEPNVVLEVDTLQIPPIQGTTSTSGPNTGTCIFTITNASASLKNKPKNALATGSDAPFNDITLQSVTVDYVWDDGAALGGQVFGIGGTVPAGGSVSAQFPLANSTVLSSGGPLGTRAGHTASLSIQVHGVTVSGDTIASDPVGGTLAVNDCL